MKWFFFFSTRIISFCFKAEDTEYDRIVADRILAEDEDHEEELEAERIMEEFKDQHEQVEDFWRLNTDWCFTAETGGREDWEADWSGGRGNGWE